jgi:hypothetical protein
VTVAPGGVLKFKWIATKGSSNLVSFTIERDNTTLPGYPYESIPNDNYKDSVFLEAPLNENAYVYELIVTDKNDLTASGSFTITVEQAVGSINYRTATLIAHQSATGSSFASITGDVYLMDDVKTKSTCKKNIKPHKLLQNICSKKYYLIATVIPAIPPNNFLWLTCLNPVFKSISLTSAGV